MARSIPNVSNPALHGIGWGHCDHTKQVKILGKLAYGSQETLISGTLYQCTMPGSEIERIGQAGSKATREEQVCDERLATPERAHCRVW